ncbi:mucin-7-like [Macrobrachium nipponense]|uniref:mucin-7-like n=1 Tax=Macrobrachium nipponense TaxID=159736 RepID=UPI0030C89BAD
MVTYNPQRQPRDFLVTCSSVLSQEFPARPATSTCDVAGPLLPPVPVAAAPVPVPAIVAPARGIAAPTEGPSGQVQPGPFASATALGLFWIEDLTVVLKKLKKKKRKVSSSSSSAAASSPSTSKASRPRKKKAASFPHKEPRSETSKGLSHSNVIVGASAGPPVPSGTGPISPSARKKKTGTEQVPANNSASSPGARSSTSEPRTVSAAHS